MGKGFFQIPIAVNEPVKSYAPEPQKERQFCNNTKPILTAK